MRYSKAELPRPQCNIMLELSMCEPEYEGGGTIEVHAPLTGTTQSLNSGRSVELQAFVQWTTFFVFILPLGVDTIQSPAPSSVSEMWVTGVEVCRLRPRPRQRRSRWQTNLYG